MKKLMAIAALSALLLCPDSGAQESEEYPPYRATMTQRLSESNPQKSVPSRSLSGFGLNFNAFANPSFESGNLNGWEVADVGLPTTPIQVAGAGVSNGFGFFESEPTDGVYCLIHGWDGEGSDNISLRQVITVPSVDSELAFDYRHAWDLTIGNNGTQARRFRVRIQTAGGGSTLESILITSIQPGTKNMDAGAQSATVDLSAYTGQSIRVEFQWSVPESFTGPAFFQLDNIVLRPTTDKSWLFVGTPPTNVVEAAANLDATLISTPDLSKSALDGYDVLIVGEESNGAFVRDSATLVKVADFVREGGGLYAESPGGISVNDYSWVPNAVLSNVTHSDGISIVLPSHPIASGVTDAGLDNWLNSSHGNFTFLPSLQPVFTQTDNGFAVTVVGSAGIGRTVYSNLDAQFAHSGGNTTEQLVLDNILDFVDARQNLLLIGTSPGGELGSVDLQTGAFTTIAPAASSIEGLTYDRNNDVLYGVHAFGGLFIINQSDASTVDFVSTITGLTGLAYDRNTNKLWASNYQDNGIYLIDPSDGTATLVGLSGLSGGELDGLDFDPINNRLYGVFSTFSTNSRLVLIDQSTGLATDIGGIKSGVTDITGLAFNDDDGFLYAVSATTGKLLRIDPLTSNSTNVGDVGTSLSTLNGLAYRSPKPKHYTQRFSSNHDLDGTRITFVPNGSNSYYQAYREPSQVAYSVDPVSSTTVTLGDDAFHRVDLQSGKTVSIYGTAYSRVFIGSNGYLTFQSGDTGFDDSLSNHFAQPRVAGLFTDLHPGQGGRVSYRQMHDRFVVTYENVPRLNTFDDNDFQIELFFGGPIRITWLNTADGEGLSGLSEGIGIPGGFTDYDLSDAIFTIPDSDLDGMPDFWEVLNGLDPNDGSGDNGAAGDKDGDGATNLTEYLYSADPNLTDTDGDGLSDNEEISTYGTDPASVDTDGDGDSDWVEVAAGFDPLDPNSFPSAYTWVDFSFLGLEEGSYTNPYNTITEANNNVSYDGTVSIRAGSSTERLVLDRRATFMKNGTGTVRIGVAP